MDVRAKKILLNTYWKNGWIDRGNRKTLEDDFVYAKAKGLMFDALPYISHDDCIEQILALRSKISKELLGRAFLASLSTQRLDWRSALASYHVASQLESHCYSPVVSGQSYENGKVVHTSYTCGVCRDAMYGMIGDENYTNEDLNVLNFERIKWGGVRHGELLYTWLDLQLFLRENISEPTLNDIEILENILATISNSEKGDFPSTLEQNLKDVLKSSKNERKTILEILACIGILEPKSFDRPMRGKSDWVYVTYWRGEDGYNADIANQYFGEYVLFN